MAVVRNTKVFFSLFFDRGSFDALRYRTAGKVQKAKNFSLHHRVVTARPPAWVLAVFLKVKGDILNEKNIGPLWWVKLLEFCNVSCLCLHLSRTLLVVFSGVNNSQPPLAGLCLVAAVVVFFLGSYRVSNPKQPVDDSAKKEGETIAVWINGLPQISPRHHEKWEIGWGLSLTKYMGWLFFANVTGKSSICTFYQGTVYDGNCSMFWECIHFILHFSPPKHN